MTEHETEAIGTAGFGLNIRRDYHVVVGKTYRVEPLNPKAVKNRGRLCTVESLISPWSKDRHAGSAVVRFQDTNRVGHVTVFELVEASVIPSADSIGNPLENQTHVV